MLNIDSITAVVILLLPLLIDLLKRVFPTNSDNAVKVLVGVVSIVAAVVVSLVNNPVLNVNDLILRIGVIYTLAQVTYDKLFAGTGLSKALSGGK